MYRNRLILVIVILLVTLFGCTAAKTSQKQVLLILKEEESSDRELMLTKEVGVMVDMLQKASFKVVTASDSGQPLAGAATTIKPDMKLADVKVEEYAGVIIPCMATGFISPSSAASEIIKKAADLGIPIAAQFSSVGYLYEIGILDGKQFAMASEIAAYAPKAIWKGEGIVQDGNIITSSICPYRASQGAGPDGTPELTRMFIDTLKSNP